MIDFNTAIQLATKKLKECSAEADCELAILESETIQFEYGWMFFYQSKEFVATGDMDYLVGGNAPIIVDKYDSSIHVTGTQKDEQAYLQDYINGRDKGFVP